MNYISESCYGDIELGWWSGSVVVPGFPTPNRFECAKRCCANKACKLWVWRTRDKECHLKDDTNLEWHSDPTYGHFTAITYETMNKVLGIG